MTSIIDYFNSIKVQLEQILTNVFLHITIFQFHKGTIRTDAADAVPLDIRNFNSIKVQLEHACWLPPAFPEPISIP